MSKDQVKRDLFDQVMTIASDSQNPDALRAVLHGESVDVQIMENGWSITPAYRLARAGNQEAQEAAEWLLGQGANISFVAGGAALGGHKKWCEALIEGGAGRNSVVVGAAFRGDREWCDELLSQGADIESLAIGLASGGHRDWCEPLLEMGVDIDLVVVCAAQGGHRDWCDALIARGADINQVAEAAISGGQISRDNPLSQLKYLCAFSPETIPRLRVAFRSDFQSIEISDDTCRRACAVSHLIRERNLTVGQAMVVSDVICDTSGRGSLFLLMQMVPHGSNGVLSNPPGGLPDLLWLKIVEMACCRRFEPAETLAVSGYGAALFSDVRFQRQSQAARTIAFSWKRHKVRKYYKARKEMIADLNNYIDIINKPGHRYLTFNVSRTSVNSDKNAAALQLIGHLKSTSSGDFDVEQCISGELGRICRRFCSDSIKRSLLPDDLVSRFPDLGVAAAGCAVS